MTQKEVRPYKITSLIAIIVFVTSLFIFLGVLGGAYDIAKRSVSMAIKNSYKQKFLTSKLILSAYTKQLENTATKYTTIQGLGRAIKKGKKRRAKELLQSIDLNDQDMNFDLIFIETLDEKLFLDESSPYYNTKTISKMIIGELGTSQYQTEILTIKEDDKVFQLLMTQTEIIEPQTEELVGRMYVGLVLSDSSELAENIKNNSNSRGVLLSIDARPLTSSEQHNSDIYNMMTDSLSNVGLADILIKDDIVSKTGIVTRLGDRDVYATILDNFGEYQQLRKIYLLESLIWFFIIVTLIAITLFVFKSIIEKALNKLLRYTFQIQNEPENIHFESTTISEFNTIGHAMETMIKKLESSETKFQGIFNQSFQFVGLLSPEGELQVTNQTSLDSKGVNAGEVVGRPFWETPWWSHSIDIQHRVKEAVQSAAKGELSRAEVDYYNTSGEIRYLDFSVKPVLNKANEIVMLIPEGRDITDLKKAEKELEAHKSRLEVLVKERTLKLSESLNELEEAHIQLRRITKAVDSSSEAIIIATHTGELFYQNKAFSNLFGYHAREVQSLSTVFTDQAHLELMIESIRNGEEWLEKRSLKSKAGKQSTILIRGNLTQDSFVGKELIVMIFTDISKLESVEAKLMKARSEKLAAENANKAKSAFLANMSHELRTPLHCITSFSGLAQKKVKAKAYDKVPTYLDYVTNCSDDLYRLIENLLLLSSLEAGLIRYTKHQHSVRNLLSAALSQFKTIAAHKNIEFDYIQTDEQCLAQIDSLNMQHVVRCLVSNAIEYSNEGEKITIKSWETVEDSREYTVVQITNIGTPIPDKELNVIFDKFVQGSKTSTGAGGTGLGLSICKIIIEDHGGKIWASSDESGKTELTFQLPKEREGDESV